MEKNYNYNYENRSQGQKLPVSYSNLGVSSCTSKVLKKSPVTNGSLWHTTDTNEFYYDWNGKRTKLNLTGDSAAVSAEIAKIKADVAKLDPAAIESKINAATSKAQKAVNDAKAAVDRVDDIEDSVNDAITAANNAVSAANAAAESANTAAAGIDEKIAGKADASVVTTLQNTVSDLETSISNKANASDVAALSQSISNKADSSTVESLAQSVTSLSEAVSNKVDASVVESLAQSVSEKANASDVVTLAQSVTSLSNAVSGKVDTSVVTALEETVAGKVDASVVDSLTQSVSLLSEAVSGKVDASVVDSLAQSITSLSEEVSNKADASVVTALDAKVNDFQDAIDGKASKDEFDALKEVVEAIEIPDVPTKVSAFENDKEYITRVDIEDGLLSSEDRAALEAIKDLGASDFETGTFPSGQDVDDTVAPSDGLTTVQDVIDYVNAFFEKKKDELEPVEPGTPYLYTNGYKLGDTPTELTDPLNRYEIVLDENDEFEIELLHKNEEDGWFDIEDPSGNYYGTYFKVIVPNGYTVKTYLWDETANPPAYSSDDTSVTDPAYSLIAEDSTPDNTTYYYKDAVEGFLFSGAKQAIEDDIQQNYNGHLIKLVLKK